ncbi:MAG: substrate-binding domain-containing protein [Bacteroidia bacterium]
MVSAFTSRCPLYCFCIRFNNQPTLMISRPFFFLLLLVAAACAGAPSDKQSGEGRPRIAVIPKSVANTYWQYVKAGAQQAGQTLGCEIVWQGPADESDLQRQIALMQDFTAEGVAAIVLAPLDSRSLVASVKAARKRGIPVIIFDSDLEGEGYDSFVATDNLDAGRECARFVGQLTGLGEKPRIAVLRYLEGSASTTAREAGFLQGLAADLPDAQVVSAERFAGTTVESAFTAAAELLKTAQPDLVFCPNESSTQGMLQAIAAYGKPVRLVGFDANETLIAGLQAGQIEGLAMQDPKKMGYLAVETAMKVIGNQPFPGRINTEIHILTRENISQPDMQSLLNLP